MDKETREFLERMFGSIDQRFTGIDDKFEETKRYFGVVAEGLRSEIQQVAEGHQNILDGQTRIVGRVEQAERELGAMIRLSYTELEHRIRAMEEDMLTLKTRVDRIEARQG